MVTALRLLARLMWALGSVAGWVCTRCYRLSGRLNGYSFEVSQIHGATAPVPGVVKGER